MVENQFLEMERMKCVTPWCVGIMERQVAARIPRSTVTGDRYSEATKSGPGRALLIDRNV